MSLDVSKFLFDTPLYKRIKLDKDNISEDLSKLNKSDRIMIKGYNPIQS